LVGGTPSPTSEAIDDPSKSTQTFSRNGLIDELDKISGLSKL
jgi:hypothetical protein